MKKIITLTLLLFSVYSKAQTYNGATGVILDNGTDTYFDLTVSGLSPTQLNDTFGIKQVCINITHPAVEELYIYLQSPSGIIVELTEGSSCWGQNYTNTCFESSAGTAVSNVNAPYTGLYKPIGYLGRFNTWQNSNGTWRLIVHDGVAFSNTGNVDSWSITFANNPPKPVSFTSSNLPIVIINTNYQPITDVKTMSTLGIIYNGPGNRNNLTDPQNNFMGNATIHIRGNTSRNFEKKPYSLETTNSSGSTITQPVLGMPIESDWDMIAMYQDKSLIRIPFTYDLGRRMGHYASRFMIVEAVLNNEYRGIYAFTEKIKQDKNRVNVTKLTPADNLSPAITGGYIFKIDRTDAAGWYSLLPGDPSGTAHFYYNYIYPKDTVITTQQKAYIKSFMDDFETLMASPSFADPVNGYSKFIHVGSFVDFFIINELSKNVDAYRLSSYMYKDNIVQGGKLHAGPLWDYDLAYHNCNYGNAFDYHGWQYQIQDTVHPSPNWWSRLMTDTNFVDQLYCRWTDLRKGILSNASIYTYIDSLAAVLNESQQRNFIQWPIIGTYIFPNPQYQAGATYASEVTDLKTWIANRTAWLDGAIVGHCPYSTVGVDENNPQANISVYPNPLSSNATFDIRLYKETEVSLKIYDVLGKEVTTLLNEHKSSGEYRINFDRKESAAGIYFYQLKMNDGVRTGKIVMQ